VPKPEYLEFVIDGAREFELSAEYLQKILIAGSAVPA
jgi:hypothetical protein